MIEEYELYYKNIIIGNFNIDTNNNFCNYYPLIDNINKIDDLIVKLVSNEFHGNIIDFSFINSRIKDMKKFNNLTECKYVNNSYWIKRVR
jgi:hypothetical protein